MKITRKLADRMTLFLVLLVTAATLWLIPKIKVDGSSEIFIPTHHAVREINDRIEGEFGSMDSIILGVRVNFGTVLEPEILTLISRLTDEFKALPEVDRIMSLTNMDYIESSPDGMEVVPLLQDLTPEGIKLMKERLTDWQDVYLGNFISRDSRLAVVIIQPVRDAQGGGRANQVLYEKIRELTDPLKSANISFPVAGMPVVKEEISSSILSDLAYLIPLVAFLILLILYLSFRRWEGVVYPLLSLVVACLWVMGLMGALGVTFTMASMLVPILLLVVGSAYGIHLMSHFYEEISLRSEFISPREVHEILRKGISNIRLSVILAGATTAGGFISQLSSPLGPFRAFGILSAVGVLSTQLTMFLIIPMLLRFQFRKGIDPGKFHRSAREERGKTPSVFLLFERISRRRKGVILLGSAILIIATAAVLPRLNVGINLIGFFRKDSELARDTAVFNGEMSGTGVLSVLIEAPDKGDILNPQFLDRLDHFGEYIRSRSDAVGNVQTLVPHIKRINRIMNYDQVPYADRGDETETIDFFSDAAFDVSPYTKIGKTSLPFIADNAAGMPLTMDDTADLLGRVLLDAGPDPSSEDIVKSFLARSNYRGAAFDEIPLDPAKYGLKTEEDLKNLLSQYMVLYSGSLDMIVNDNLEPDKTLITVQVTDEKSAVLGSLIKDIDSYWNYYLPDGWTCSVGGGSAISYALSSLVTRSQFFSLGGALVIVFLIVSAMFRSFKGGLIAMIPVFFGVLGIFLFMILFHFNLDIVTSLLASLAIGIGVDYAIHFMNAYKRCRKEGRKNVLDAVYRTTGKAIFVNALSVSVGFLALLISRFIPIQQLGILFSISMFFASLSSLIVLPMVLEHFQPAFLDR